MLNNYYNTTFTHNYILGVADKKGKVVKAYFVNLDLEGFKMMFNSPTTSRTALVYRYNSNRKKVAYLNDHATKIMTIDTIEHFENSLRIRVNKKGKEYRENRGEYFEYLMSTILNVKQNDLSNLSHTEGGDVEVNGVAYQVKYERSGVTVGYVK